jgi:hypothetical protein
MEAERVAKDVGAEDQKKGPTHEIDNYRACERI